jgi:hypothetical protein
MAGGGSKAGERRGGRQKGTPNKITADLKSMILGALEAKGGQGYLEQQATENPVAFLTLVGKVLPLTLHGDPTAPVTFTVVTGVPRSENDEAPSAPDDLDVPGAVH